MTGWRLTKKQRTELSRYLDLDIKDLHVRTNGSAYYVRDNEIIYVSESDAELDALLTKAHKWCEINDYLDERNL